MKRRLEFDMAMVEFSCNQIDDGDLLMRQSAESARVAGDTTGVYMAEILGPLHRIKAMVAEGRDPTHLITMFSREVKEVEVLNVLGQRQLGDGHLVPDRAGLLLAISEVSRSPTTRSGSCI